MSVIMSVTFGHRPVTQIELVLTRDTERYTVSVNDSEGLLHLTEFPFDDTIELLDANEQALEWFDTVHEAITQYVDQSGSQAIRNLVNTLQ